MSIENLILDLEARFVWWEAGRDAADDIPMRHFGARGGPYRVTVGEGWGDHGRNFYGDTLEEALRAVFLAMPPNTTTEARSPSPSTSKGEGL